MAALAGWPVAVLWLEAVAVASGATFVVLTGVPTVMVTVEALLDSVPLETTNEKVRVVGLKGAVKVGSLAEELERVTLAPAVWVQA
jgi:hypothetical protein